MHVTFQVVFSLTCEQGSNPVKVEVVLHSFPADADSLTVTCKTARNQLVWAQVHFRSFHLDTHTYTDKVHTIQTITKEWINDVKFLCVLMLLGKILLQVEVEPACSPHCKISFSLAEVTEGYDVTLRANTKHAVVEEKSFHFGEYLNLNAPFKMSFLWSNMLFFVSSSRPLVFPWCARHSHHSSPHMETSWAAESVDLQPVQHAHALTHTHLQHQLIRVKLTVPGGRSAAWHSLPGQCCCHYRFKRPRSDLETDAEPCHGNRYVLCHVHGKVAGGDFGSLNVR